MATHTAPVESLDTTERELAASLALLRRLITTGNPPSDEALVSLYRAWQHIGKALEIITTDLRQLHLPEA